MSIPITQFIPSPFLVTISLFSTSVTLFLLCKYGHLCLFFFFFLDSTDQQYQMVFVSV